MKITAVIMAGGKGERFWPKSRTNCPKQFLSLTSDGKTMLQKTVDRLRPLVPMEDIYIITNQEYLPFIEEQIPELPAENVIGEPCPRNTAPCIGLAASLIQKKHGDAVMMVLPSDHLIHAQELYLDILRKATIVAENNRNLVTIGITPSYPETGYGYIRYVTGSGKNGVYQTAEFAEKPDLETAKRYLHEHCYLWNSGMFIWKASSILWNMEQLMPDLYNGIQEIMNHYGTDDFSEVLNAKFPELPSESVDYGIMEKAENIYTIPASFGWDDVGSWLSLERINPKDQNGNFFSGDIVSVDTKRCTVSGSSKLIALVGIRDIIIVDTPDALLVCHKNNTQDIKKILTELREENRTNLL